MANSKTRNLVCRNGWWTFRVRVNGKLKWVALGTQNQEDAIRAADAMRRTLQAERLRIRLEAGGIRSDVAGDDAIIKRLGLVRQREGLATIPEIERAFLADADGRQIKERSAGNALSSLKLVIRTARGDAAALGSASVLTEQLLIDYQSAKIREAKPAGPAALEAALVTAASTIAQARSVFCAEALRGSAMRQLRLPDLSAFRAFRPQGSTHRVRVEVDDTTLQRLRAASDELWFSAPGRWLAFALCCGIGLRRGEAKRARWDWVRVISGRWVIYLVADDAGAPKGNEHKKEVDGTLWKDMCAVRDASSDYILPGATEADRDEVLQSNVEWLRDLGIDVDKPNHELRAIYLQALDRKHGRAAAQLGAGHGDARTTEIYTGRGTAPAVRPL